jgi:hypothetical protein
MTFTLNYVPFTAKLKTYTLHTFKDDVSVEYSLLSLSHTVRLSDTSSTSSSTLIKFVDFDRHQPKTWCLSC